MQHNLGSWLAPIRRRRRSRSRKPMGCDLQWQVSKPPPRLSPEPISYTERTGCEQESWVYFQAQAHCTNQALQDLLQILKPVKTGTRSSNSRAHMNCSLVKCKDHPLRVMPASPLLRPLDLCANLALTDPDFCSYYMSFFAFPTRHFSARLVGSLCSTRLLALHTHAR